MYYEKYRKKKDAYLMVECLKQFDGFLFGLVKQAWKADSITQAFFKDGSDVREIYPDCIEVHSVPPVILDAWAKGLSILTTKDLETGKRHVLI